MILHNKDILKTYWTTPKPYLNNNLKTFKICLEKF